MNNNNFAIIIGGSGSLGQAISKKFLSKGYNLLITGRDSSKLESCATQLHNNYSNCVVKHTVLDFSDTETYKIFLNEVEQIKNNTAIVINTAAGFYKGSFLDMSLSQVQSLIDSNYKSIIAIFHSLIKSMINLKHNIDFINITSYSSATNLDISKSSSLHIATKAALQIFDTVLSNELLNTNIRLSTVAPSTFAKTDRKGLPLNDIAELLWLLHNIPKSIKIDTIIASFTGNS